MLLDPQIEALRRVYLASGIRIRQALLSATLGSFDQRRSQLLLRQVEAELARLNTYVGNWENGQLALAYGQGGDTAIERIAALPQTAGVDRAFATLPREPLQALSREVAGQRSRFVGAILRQSRDYLRTLAGGELARGLGLGDSPLAVGRAIREQGIARLLDRQPLQALVEGIDRACGVVYADGSVHSLHAYGEMSARTGTLAALNEGALQRYEQAGIHLVQVSTHQTLCFLCLVRGSRVLTSTGYKPVEAVQAGELVRTHKGRWRSVVRAMAHEHSGDLVTIEALGQSLTVTPEHPVLTLDG